MVSPSKKKKSEKKGRETQAPAPLNHVNQQDLTKKTNSKSSSRKPLATKKVYLDIRSTTVLTKLEKDLKQLGAKVEPFLDTDIDYFVTDRSSASTTATKCANQLNQALGTPSPFVVSAGGPSPSPSPGLLTAAGGSTSSAAAAAVPSPSPGGGGNNVGLRRNGSSHHHVTRSRAEAMLDCVRAPFLANDVTTLNNHNHQHQHTTVDPIENARAHNVPIYQVQQFVRWVEKLIERTKSAGGSSSQQRRVKVLNKEFLKLEECNGRNKRPEFRELNLWPTLRYEGTPGGPFETRGGSARLAATASGNKRLQRQNAPQQLPAQPQRSSRRGVKQTQAAAAADRMTRKDTAASGLGGGGGYCEMCCLDYGDLSQHLASPGHLKLAQDPAQYAALDSLIRDACLDTLLSNGTATNATGANNHCSIVLSPLNVGGFTNNNNSTSSSRRVLRSARGGGGGASVIAPQQNGVACAGMGNRQATSPSNGHHNTRSSQQQQKGGKVASSPQEVKDNTPATPVLNGIINHNHLTRLSVRTDLAAVATPTLATPTTLVTPTESEVGVASGASGGGRTRQASGGTSSRSSTCGVDATATCGQHLLRSKKQLRLPQALQGTTAEDQDTPRGGLDTPRGGLDTPRGAVDTPRGAVDTPRGGVDTPRGGESSRMMLKRRRCKMRRRKRLSVEEKLIEDNRSYYKVEVLNSKLRSTGYYMSQRELELNRGTSATRGDHHQPQLHCSVANSSAAAATAAATSVANSCSMSPPPALTETGVPTSSPEKQPVVMRFKKVRKSELSLLSDEAENFMFGDTSRQHHHHPHHHLRSSDHDDDDDHHQHHEEYEEECEDDEENTTSTAGTRSGGLSTAAPLADESSNCSSLSNLPLKRGRPGRPPKKNKRKRRTHAELFINDNLDYYKFDLSGSRLRHGGQVKVEEEVEGGRREGDGVLGLKIKEEIKEEVQSDEEEADGEEGEEFGKQLTADEISFAFESAPVHESWYQTYRRQDEAREQYMQAYHSYPVLRLPYEYRDKQKRRLLAQMASGSGAKAFAFRRRKKRGSGGGVLSSVLGKRGVSALDDKPRKSPRCHASTLAILSTLKYRRRRISPLTSLSPSATTTLSQMTPTKSSVVVDEPATISSPAVTENVTISRTRMLENSAKVGRRRRLVPSEDFVALADSLDNYFCEFYFENGGVEEDRYASTMRKLVDCWVECQSGTGSSDVVGDEEVEVKKEESLSPSTSKRLAKPKHSPSTSSEPDPSSSSSSVQPCCCTRDVDPAIFDDNWLMGGDFATSRGDFALTRGDFASSGVFPPGPQQDFLQLLAGYRQCNSMERALYGGHTINPRAVESLRRHVVTSLTGGGGGGGTAAESCASSECGGSSTGELLGFTEDGRMLSKRRKRKKRNMTGWPKDKPKKLLVQQQLKMATTSGCSRSLQKVDEQEVEAEEESLVLKLRRTATKCDDATADDDNSSCGESVRVRRNEADENSSSGDRVSRVRRDVDKIVDENIISGDRVRRCRVLSVSGVDGGATTSTRSVLRRRAASMTSSRRGGGGRRGGRRGGGVRR